MTFRLDVRWRRKAVRLLALAAGSTVIDLASGTGDLCIDLARAGHRPISVDLSFGMLARRPQRRAARAGRHPAPAGPRRLGRRRHVRLRAAQPRRPAGVLRRARRGSCAPAGGSRCSTSASRTTALIRWGNNIYFGKVVPKIGALLSDGAAYRYLPKSVAYLPAQDEMLAELRARRLRRRRAPPALRRPHAAAARAPGGATREGGHPAARRDDVDLNDVAAGDGYLFVRDGVGFAGRGVAARVPGRRRAGLPRVRSITTTTSAACRPIAFGMRAVRARRPGELIVPAGRRRQGGRRPAVGDHASATTAARRLDRRRARDPAARGVHRRGR